MLASAQLTAPQGVPSCTGAEPQPSSASQVGARHGFEGAAHSVAVCWQPRPSAQASLVHASPSSQRAARPAHTPPRHAPASMHCSSSEQLAPSSLTVCTQLSESGSNCTSSHGLDAPHAGASTPSPVTGTATASRSRTPVATPSSVGVKTSSSSTSAPPGTSSVGGAPNGASIATLSVRATRDRLTTCTAWVLGKLRAVGRKSTRSGTDTSPEPSETTPGSAHAASMVAKTATRRDGMAVELAMSVPGSRRPGGEPDPSPRSLRNMECLRR